AKSIFQEQGRLREQVAKLKEQIPAGTSRETLPESKQAELEKATELQNMLATRTNQLVEKLSRMARERAARTDASGRAGDPSTNNVDAERAQRLQEAAARAEQGNAPAKMQDAAKSIQENKL